MSDFFRIRAPVSHVSLTLRQLAVMVHDAEETADDVTLIECFDELERRGMGTPGYANIFMAFYREEWKRRMSKP